MVIVMSYPITAYTESELINIFLQVDDKQILPAFHHCLKRTLKLKSVPKLKAKRRLNQLAGRYD